MSQGFFFFELFLQYFVLFGFRFVHCVEFDVIFTYQIHNVYKIVIIMLMFVNYLRYL